LTPEQSRLQTKKLIKKHLREPNQITIKARLLSERANRSPEAAQLAYKLSRPSALPRTQASRIPVRNALITKKENRSATKQLLRDQLALPGKGRRADTPKTELARLAPLKPIHLPRSA
jgi:hypothetical protein